MHILFTRPLDESKELMIRFKDLGHKISHLPLLKIESVKYDHLNFEEFKGIIFTSSNAIKNLNTKFIDKKILCFCVGTFTERTSRAFGFQNVYAADGNVENLKELILSNFKKNFGALLYVSGEIISYNIDKDLIEQGYSVRRLINYKSIPIETFDLKFVDKLKKFAPDVVYIYSLNSAKNFLKIIKNYDLMDCWMDTNLMCLGEKTSSELNEIKWKKIFLFNPGEEEFLLYKI